MAAETLRKAKELMAVISLSGILQLHRQMERYQRLLLQTGLRVSDRKTEIIIWFVSVSGHHRITVIVMKVTDQIKGLTLKMDIVLR